MILAIAVSATVAALVLVALLLRRARAGRRWAGPGPDTSSVAPLRSRPAASGDVYAPAFIVEPGQCFRLCRDPGTGGALPCDRQVEGTGEFLDHRGNVIEVEACAAHRVDLQNWQFRQIDS
jgi:hypothetical protein